MIRNTFSFPLNISGQVFTTKVFGPANKEKHLLSCVIWSATSLCTLKSVCWVLFVCQSFLKRPEIKLPCSSFGALVWPGEFWRKPENLVDEGGVEDPLVRRDAVNPAVGRAQRLVQGGGRLLASNSIMWLIKSSPDIRNGYAGLQILSRQKWRRDVAQEGNEGEEVDSRYLIIIRVKDLWL